MMWMPNSALLGPNFRLPNNAQCTPREGNLATNCIIIGDTLKEPMNYQPLI